MGISHTANLFGHRLRTLPLLVLYLTDGCNSRCTMCDIWQNPRQNMDLALAAELADTCADLRVRWVLLSGGEAMQHPHWPQIAQRFRERGIHVMLLTNGLLLKKQVDEVIASVDEVIVSLDGGTSETYHALRGVDAFHLVLDGIRVVRNGGVPVTTRTTVQRQNYAEIPQITAAALEAGANLVSFLAVDVSNTFAFGARDIDPSLVILPDEYGSALTATDVAQFDAVLETMFEQFAEAFATGRIAESPQKLRRLSAYFRALLGDGDFPRPRCNAPHLSTVVEVDGTVRPCYFLPSYGKLNSGHDLPSVLNNKGAQALRRAYQKGDRPECERCVCPLYKGPRALLEI